MKILAKYQVDARALSTVVVTLLGSGALVAIAPPAVRPYLLALSGTVLALQQGPIQKTPASYVEEGVAVVEKWLPLLPAATQTALRQRLAAVSAVTTLIPQSITEGATLGATIKQGEALGAQAAQSSIPKSEG